MIIIPMAGLSRRFFKEGYKLPKYMLQAYGETLFAHTVNSFKEYFDNTPFLFIIRNEFDTESFVKKEANELGIKMFSIVVLDHETRGQAETVYIGLNKFSENKTSKYLLNPITIFNIDTIRHNFTFPEIIFNSDAYIEVFKGEGDNWSFAKPYNINSTLVQKTAEKNPISDLCSTGLYHFNHANDFVKAYEDYLIKPESEWEKNELYIAPIYNYLINNGKKVHYHLIDKKDVTFCGIPTEYTDFLQKNKTGV
jgi:hypothetical protein